MPRRTARDLNPTPSCRFGITGRLSRFDTLPNIVSRSRTTRKLPGCHCLTNTKTLWAGENQGASMELSAITTTVKEIIAKITGCPAESIPDSATFVDDL